MSDKKQLLIPPGSRLPAAPRSVPTAPILTSGNSGWFTERGRYERNALTIAANTKVIDAKTAQFAAFARFVAQKEALLLVLASYEDVDLTIAHHRERGRISRTAELRREQLQNELAEVNLKIEVAQAQMRLAEALPIPEVPPTLAPMQPPPSPVGLSPTEIEEVVRASLPEVTPETLRTLSLLLQGRLAEKKS